MPRIEKNCVIIHGSPNDSLDDEFDKHWMPWIQKELELHGIRTVVPRMPNPSEPSYEAYKREFQKNKIGKNTILIGHSRGCAFLVRWLGETKQNVEKLILVAPYKLVVGDNKFKKDFSDFEIDESIHDRAEEIIIFTSDDEEKAGKDSVKIYHSALGGKIIELKGRGHYTRVDMGTERFPELLDETIL